MILKNGINGILKICRMPVFIDPAALGDGISEFLFTSGTAGIRMAMGK